MEHGISLVDALGNQHAEVSKTIYVARKQAYDDRLKQKAERANAE